jgi:hypothetical protein
LSRHLAASWPSTE